jgi:hypothetical protein
MQTTISNPAGAFQKTTTYVSGVDDEGQQHEYGCWYLTLRANAAVTRGHGLSWVDPTATVPVSVTPYAVAGTDLGFAGVAMDGATAAGAFIRVCVLGFCLVWMNAQTAAAGEILVNPTTTAGELIRAADPTHDATLVAGSILGRVFGVKDATTNLALCFIKQV